MQNEATVFGGAQLPFEKEVTMMSSVVSRSSFPLFVVFFRTVVASEIASRLWWCSSVLLFLFFSRESAKERERERCAQINARKFRTKTKRRLTCVFGRRSTMSFFSVLCCGVSFKRERKKEPKEEEETKESSRSSYIYIYIYI